MVRAPSAPIAALVLALALPAPGQTPSYRTDAAAINVDVVVLDADGRPVRGLTRDDFTVLEDGRPQTIAAFEARDLEAGPAPAAAVPELAAGATSNTGPAGAAGRTLALLVDDLGITAPVALELKARLAGWVETRARPTDEVTIMTTSGSVWWSDVLATGRDDLLAALARVQGRMVEGGDSEQMSAAEALRIDVNEANREYAAGSGARSRPVDAMPAPGGSVTLVGASATERVVQRWLDTRVCSPCSSPYDSGVDCPEIRQCFSRVQLRARELHAASARRAATLLQAVSRLSRGLAAAEGRKSILVVSEALVNDASLGRAIPDAIDAAQRSNTAVYFADARGLGGAALASAAAGSAPPRGQDTGAALAEETVLATGGGESLAAETGGTLTRSNDLALGLERMADDSSAYYLLGYQPPRPPDGSWRRLEVRVARDHVTVRARRGYRASADAGPEPAPSPRPRAPKARTAAKEGPRDVAPAGTRPLDPTILAGTARGRLPLRLATYVGESNGVDAARVAVVLEIDNGSVAVDRASVPWRAALDLTVVAAGIARPATVPVDERLDLTLGPNDVGNGWWLVRRELWLPRGVSQIRVLVRDPATGTAGLVTRRVVVPDVEHPYVSTPLLSDRTLPPEREGEPLRLVPTARRVFGNRDTLFCQYEVFGFGGQSLAGVPQLFASYRLETPDGRVASEEPFRKIETEDGRRAVRRLSLPLGRLEPGPYVLVVSIQDRLAGQTFTIRTAFEVERSETLPATH